MFTVKIQASSPLQPADRGVLRSAVEQAGERALRAARQGWPVDSGKSADSFALERAADGSGFVLVNEAPYVKHINGGRSLSEAGARSEAVLSGLEDELSDLLLSSLG